MLNKGCLSVTVLAFSVSLILFKRCGLAFEMGQLKCSENGMHPDDKLISMVMQKCQPKLDDSKDLLIACVTKCVLKQMKAIDKKGKINQTEAMTLASVLPDEYQEKGKEKFNECYEQHHSKIKKGSKCDSWIPFSSCFMGFAESLCKPASTTTASP